MYVCLFFKRDLGVKKHTFSFCCSRLNKRGMGNETSAVNTRVKKDTGDRKSAQGVVKWSKKKKQPQMVK